MIDKLVFEVRQSHLHQEAPECRDLGQMYEILRPSPSLQSIAREPATRTTSKGEESVLMTTCSSTHVEDQDDEQEEQDDDVQEVPTPAANPEEPLPAVAERTIKRTRIAALPAALPVPYEGFYTTIPSESQFVVPGYPTVAA